MLTARLCALRLVVAKESAHTKPSPIYVAEEPLLSRRKIRLRPTLALVYMDVGGFTTICPRISDVNIYSRGSPQFCGGSTSSYILRAANRGDYTLIRRLLPDFDETEDETNIFDDVRIVSFTRDITGHYATT